MKVYESWYDNRRRTMLLLYTTLLPLTRKQSTNFISTHFIFDRYFVSRASKDSLSLSLSLFVLCTAARVVFQVSIGDSKIGK